MNHVTNKMYEEWCRRDVRDRYSQYTHNQWKALIALMIQECKKRGINYYNIWKVDKW